MGAAAAMGITTPITLAKANDAKTVVQQNHADVCKCTCAGAALGALCASKPFVQSAAGRLSLGHRAHSLDHLTHT